MAKFILDTRNQIDWFVQKALNDLGHTIQREKLLFGDVALDNERHKVIDLKSSSGGLLELAKNICTNDHNRLRNEISKCFKYNGEITFMCFEPNINNVDEIINWEIPKFKNDIWVTKYFEKETNKPITKRVVNIGKVNYYTKRIKIHNKGELITQVKPEILIKSIKTMSEPNHYMDGKTVNFVFATKKNCGKKIVEILGC